MSQSVKAQFLIAFIRTLLGLCEIIKGKEKIAILDSNIMYAIGQYPKFKWLLEIFKNSIKIIIRIYA